MNWDDMRLFLAVARTGSISGAAKHLGVQHSTVSRRMRKLEEILGARLIERKKTGYELREAGENIKQAALRIEGEVIGMDGALRGKDTNLVGPLRVTAINNMASSVLMPMFADFTRQHPQVDLHIIVSNSDASLPQREADIAIRLTNSPSDTLIGKRMVTIASTIYGSRDYLKQLKKPGGEPKWIGVECCLFHKTWTKQHCGNQSFDFFSDDTLLTLSAIREGLGVSFLPCFMGDGDPLLERFSDPDPAQNLGLWILMHPDLRHTARVLAFRDHMTKSIHEKQDLFEGLDHRRR
ncbi:MAG: LysR family transcriptional regulator [gamma proteobacterium endosymbiont of Lamellibrachia anaximandri]|nr:LysR family transcriptional regulator [gamma proteobacterium endosymbiont of Lamellibrachia anaximandri]